MTMYNTYAQLCAYWRTMANTSTGIKTVTVGSDEQAIDMQTQPGLQYPHLRVDTPELLYGNGDENLTVQFTYQIFVFSAENTNKVAEEETTLSSMELALRKVYRKLHTDAYNDLFDLLPAPNTGDAIRKWSGDNCFGWAMQIKIQLYCNEC